MQYHFHFYYYYVPFYYLYYYSYYFYSYYFIPLSIHVFIFVTRPLSRLCSIFLLFLLILLIQFVVGNIVNRCSRSNFNKPKYEMVNQREFRVCYTQGDRIMSQQRRVVKKVNRALRLRRGKAAWWLPGAPHRRSVNFINPVSMPKKGEKRRRALNVDDEPPIS